MKILRAGIEPATSRLRNHYSLALFQLSYRRVIDTSETFYSSPSHALIFVEAVVHNLAQAPDANYILSLDMTFDLLIPPLDTCEYLRPHIQCA